ncbi:MAG TPA: hypothetical protein VEV17_10875 [Bryobacteraceae bacterium]|nr:hypothetical protein [Bryobacteraceae bacterium]
MTTSSQVSAAPVVDNELCNTYDPCAIISPLATAVLKDYISRDIGDLKARRPAAAREIGRG